MLLTNDNYKRLAEVGISNIGVDLDGFQPETHEKICIGGIFETTKLDIEKLNAHVRDNRLRTRFELAYQVAPGINEADPAPFVAWCNQNGYDYKLVTMHDRAGLREDVGKAEVELARNAPYPAQGSLPLPVERIDHFQGRSGGVVLSLCRPA